VSPRSRKSDLTRAAIFARKSTKDNARDEELSVARQEQLAREFAATKGWTVAGVYVDNVSGQHSNRLVERGKLLAAAGEGAFDVVIVRDSDRLSRDDREVDPVVILDGYGVRVWEYLEGGREVAVGDATERLVRNVHRYRGAVYAESASKTTREQKMSKAQIAGEHGIADGKVLGYTNVGEHKQRRRVIDPEQAKLVTRIFEMSAAGLGYLKIARTLNQERVKNPSGQDRRDTTKRSDQWSVSGIKSILERELYRGRLVYGRKRNVHTPDGRKKVDGDKVITIERPDLAIIPESLWVAAHQRKAAANRQYLRASGGRLYGKPFAGVEGKHLLSGLLECGVCGGNMFISKKTGQRGRPVTMFACSNRRAGRGLADGSPCTNVHGVPEPELTAAVMADVRKIFLDPAKVAAMVTEELKRRKAAPDVAKGQLKEAKAKVAKLEGEVERLGEAIAEGGQIKTLVTKLADRENDLRGARAALAHLEGLAAESETKESDLAGLLAEIYEIVEGLQNAVDPANPQKGRQALKHLLQTPIVIKPGTGENGEPIWSYSFTAAWAGLSSDFISSCYPPAVAEKMFGAKKVEFAGAVGRGIGTAADRMFDLHRRALKVCPRGDSNTRHAV
jgi:site-specific DNA recombinase